MPTTNTIKIKLIDAEDVIVPYNLLDSIRREGVVSPVMVRRIKGGRYELLEGRKRISACKMLNMKEIPCLVFKMTDTEITELQIISSKQYVKTEPGDYAKALKRIMKANNLTIKEIAKRIGKSEIWIRRMLRHDSNV